MDRHRIGYLNLYMSATVFHWYLNQRRVSLECFFQQTGRPNTNLATRICTLGPEAQMLLARSLLAIVSHAMFHSVCTFCPKAQIRVARLVFCLSVCWNISPMIRAPQPKFQSNTIWIRFPWAMRWPGKIYYGMNVNIYIC